MVDLEAQGFNMKKFLRIIIAIMILPNEIFASEKALNPPFFEIYIIQEIASFPTNLLFSNLNRCFDVAIKLHEITHSTSNFGCVRRKKIASYDKNINDDFFMLPMMIGNTMLPMGF
jgi:hypothetical protein